MSADDILEVLKNMKYIIAILYRNDWTCDFVQSPSINDNIYVISSESASVWRGLMPTDKFKFVYISFTIISAWFPVI